jgi:hypothetical protein
MSEPKTRPSDQAVGQFLDQIPDEKKRQDIQAIRTAYG